MTHNDDRKDLFTEFIAANELIPTNGDKVPALTWLRREQQRVQRRTGPESMVVIARGTGDNTHYALAYAGLFKPVGTERIVE